MRKISLTEEQLEQIIRRVILEKKKSKKKKSKKRKSKKKKSKKRNTTLCARGKNAAKAKYDVYPSAYANGYAVQVCKGKMPGLNGEKKCSGKYCSGK